MACCRTHSLCSGAFAKHFNFCHSFQLSKNTLVVSTGSDCSIRLWSLQGDFLGIFGVSNWWIGVDSDGLITNSSASPRTPAALAPEGHADGRSAAESAAPRCVPGDVRRVASATTLRVMKFRHHGFQFELARMTRLWLERKRLTTPTSDEVSNISGSARNTSKIRPIFQELAVVKKRRHIIAKA